MKPKDLVRHRITNEKGFILCIREDLDNRCDVLWSFSISDDDILSFRDKAIINQGCYSFEELEVI